MKGRIKRREVRVKRKENREKMENKKKIIMVNSTLSIGGSPAACHV